MHAIGFVYILWNHCFLHATPTSARPNSSLVTMIDSPLMSWTDNCGALELRSTFLPNTKWQYSILAYQRGQSRWCMGCSMITKNIFSPCCLMSWFVHWNIFNLPFAMLSSDTPHETLFIISLSTNFFMSSNWASIGSAHVELRAPIRALSLGLAP